MRHGYAKNEHNRDTLITENFEIVKKIAFHFAGRVGTRMEVQDLMQLGMVGLVEAANKYSPQKDVPFEAYAKLRIQGAIVDHLRKQSNLCRGTIKRKKDYENAVKKLEKKLSAKPSQEEIASELGIDLTTLANWQHDFAASQHRSIEEAQEYFGEYLFSVEPSVEEKILKGELRGILRENLSKLSQQQLLVLQLYYVEELNVYEIASVLSVTTGRVSQIKSAAVKQLRSLIEGQLA